ncbi:hypothetical protein [Neptunomonas phycophila]|uniref:hypothetical protein n=1 Tax=Neptunomonas phycophila TaxID=1572645 RepID=UPI0015B89BE9|nr:hypothetical protein [Neptunomonas phycophila]QLE98920.1 hypothetical protein FLM49_15490 [Neptunomonas phycophila]
MRKIQNTLFIVALSLVSNLSLAASHWSNASVKQVRAFTKQTEHLIFVSSFSNPSNCTGFTNTLVLLKDDTDNWKMVHSLLLTSLISEKRVSIRVSGCRGSFPIIDGVSVINE